MRQSCTLSIRLARGPVRPLGLAADVYETGVALPLRLAAGGNLTYQDLRRTQGLLPFHAVPVVP